MTATLATGRVCEGAVLCVGGGGGEVRRGVMAQTNHYTCTRGAHAHANTHSNTH